MKRKFVSFMVCLCAMTAFGQTAKDSTGVSAADQNIFEVPSIAQIIEEQQMVTTRLAKESHYRDVWGRRSYWDIAWASTWLEPKNALKSGFGDELVGKYTSSWGISIKRGRNYRLHKTPIANLLQFNFDFNGVDLNVNHYKQDAGQYLYDSHNTKDGTAGSSDAEYYFPWKLEKYEANYGMSLGPSLTIAPFNSLDVMGLHYLKINVYYHIGYHISGIYAINDEHKDANQSGRKDDAGNDIHTSSDYEKMKKNVKIAWGHGLINSFGFNISWKVIGLGYEHRSANIKYKALMTGDFGKDTYDFRSGSNRIYLHFRL